MPKSNGKTIITYHYSLWFNLFPNLLCLWERHVLLQQDNLGPEKNFCLLCNIDYLKTWAWRGGEERGGETTSPFTMSHGQQLSLPLLVISGGRWADTTGERCIFSCLLLQLWMLFALKITSAFQVIASGYSLTSRNVSPWKNTLLDDTRKHHSQRTCWTYLIRYYLSL